MKKIVVLFAILMVLLLITTTVSAEQVEGLREHLEALYLKNNFTESEIADMESQYVEYQTVQFWNTQFPYIQMSGKWRTESRDEQEELHSYLDYVQLDFNYGIYVTTIEPWRWSYAGQYAKEGNFSYLFGNKPCWVVPFKQSVDGKMYVTSVRGFTDEGTFIEKVGEYQYRFYMSAEEWLFVNNPNNIECLLVERGENKVTDIKFFTDKNSHLRFMYIKCEVNEYLIKLAGWSEGSGDIIPGLESLKIYEINEAMGEFAKEAEKLKVEYQDVPASYEEALVKKATDIKPTYETEALALQSEGLLKGNENGLDLLKPLTRIEAATMLLRAMGEPVEESSVVSNDIQVFSDVTASHWGFSAAQKAYDLGLVNGVGDNLFAPDESVTATQFSTMVLRAADATEFDWEHALNILIERGIITEEETKTMDFFTRGDMAKIIYEARENGLLQ